MLLAGFLLCISAETSAGERASGFETVIGTTHGTRVLHNSAPHRAHPPARDAAPGDGTRGRDCDPGLSRVWELPVSVAGVINFATAFLAMDSVPTCTTWAQIKSCGYPRGHHLRHPCCDGHGPKDQDRQESH
jgi:hypothetical protein